MFRHEPPQEDSSQGLHYFSSYHYNSGELDSRYPISNYSQVQSRLIQSSYARRRMPGSLISICLPGRLIVALVWTLVVQAPGAIWAGANTPVVTTANVSGTFVIGSYSTDRHVVWGEPLQCFFDYFRVGQCIRHTMEV